MMVDIMPFLDMLLLPSDHIALFKSKVSADTSSNSAPVVNNSLKGKDESAESNVPDASAISAFMTQVSDLVK